jgi:hypothetical protein
MLAHCTDHMPHVQLLHSNINKLRNPYLLPLDYAVMNASTDSQAYTQFVAEALLEA